MQLISQLQEAADLPIDQVIPAIKKDKRVRMVLQRIGPDDIENKKEFLDTLKYYFLNNQNVVAFANKVGDATEHFTGRWFKSLRNRIQKPEDINEFNLEQLRNSLADFRKEQEKATKPKLKRELEDAIYEWNGDHWHRFQQYHGKYLKNYPGLRPDHKLRLYRGVLFHERDLREEPSMFPGEPVTVGSGLKFMRSIREGSRVADLEWDSYTGWTTDLAEAEKLAIAGPRHYNSGGRKTREGSLGFVISTLAEPDDIVVEMNKLNAVFDLKVKANDVILEPGKYTCRVVKRFSHHGEEDPLATNADMENELEELTDMFSLLNGVITLPVEAPPSDALSNVPQRHTPIYPELIKPETTEKIEKLLDTVTKIYREHLAPLSDDELQKLSGGKLGKTAAAAKGIKKLFDQTMFIGSRKSGKTAKRADMTGKEQHEAHNFNSAHDLNAILRSPKRWTNWATSQPIIALSHLVGETVPKDAHLRSHAFQQEWVKRVLKGYEQLTGRQLPADRAEVVKQLVSEIQTYERNATSLRFLQSVKDLLSLVPSED